MTLRPASLAARAMSMGAPLRPLVEKMMMASPARAPASARRPGVQPSSCSHAVVSVTGRWVRTTRSSKIGWMRRSPPAR